MSGAGASYLFWLLEPGAGCAPVPAAGTGYRTELWRPAHGGTAPAGAGGASFQACWLLARLGVFANRDYGHLAVYAGSRLVHRSGVYPGFFRFPFMGRDDLQIGNTWTDPEHRGRGLAAHAVREVVARTARPGRRFWYVVEDSNAASIRVIEKAGFVLAGRGERTSRLGLRALGAFELTLPAG
jgi:ribosomal protein S18 acetylase RimI-like enzyme